MMDPPAGERRLRVGLAGVGMICDETHLPLLEQLRRTALMGPYGSVEVRLAAVASRTGQRAERLRDRLGDFESLTGPDAVARLAALPLDVVIVATPDDRHFAAARAALAAGKHVLIEKPSVLRLQELDELVALSRDRGVLAKVVYHKLFDPDHRKLRTHVADGVLRHVNNGYCSLLEPRAISRVQFAEWIAGRNPGTYVAVHYLKLIDFTFGSAFRLHRILATGQRGLVAPADATTWDSVQLQFVYEYPDGREAAFDVHTSWVAPDRFPGSVEQEVQFRFDNGVWNAHQRKRGVEMAVDDATALPITPNHHYSTDLVEPWGERRRCGYGLDAPRRFFEELAEVEFGGPPDDRPRRLEAARAFHYNDLAADRNVVAVVQALEAILARHAAGRPGCFATVNSPRPGLWLHVPGESSPECLYSHEV